ncbi:M24 family metallopeptidase [Brevibacillus dissolubilis]|uniref:M24 family metallopeptidase n=1 Tax=Brevibacillus dissolubilis TaxID=1844116 RepID=UPI0011164D95|nr:M24 family metallopeptidase [Brevibacillus dissolubilis]
MREGKFFKERVTIIRDLMEMHGLDGILLRRRRSFSWLTGGLDNQDGKSTEFGVADLLILPEEVYCISNRMDAVRMEREVFYDGSVSCTLITPEWYEGNDAAIQQLCKGKSIGLDLPTSLIDLEDTVDLGTELAETTYVLSPDEVNRYRDLCQMVAKTVEDVCRELEPGMTEYEIQARLAEKVWRLGITPRVMQIATDERIYRYRNPVATDKQLDTYAMLSLSAEKAGLHANVTRLVHFGPLSPELLVNRKKLAEIEVGFLAATSPGRLIRDVFAKGIQAYREAGYPYDWRYLNQGGPTGYAAREFHANYQSTGRVQVNQAFAWNPAVYGVKTEDTMLVGDGENEILTHTGEWPSILISKNGKDYLRPDILIREK